MADRNVKVTISAQVQQYIEGMEKAARATRETGSEAEKLAQKRDAFNLMGASAMAMGAAAAVGVGLAVAKWADFDQAMSNVQAATHESEANMKLLSDAALEAGARTVFSAEESANAIEELAKAGVSTADILNGALDGALDLAAAGNLGVAEAAGIAATALKTFKLEGSDMAHVADLLAAGAGKAMGDVTDLSAALNQSAMVANATGLSIEETTAGLAAFASQGLLGSDAGTSFKAMLQSLTPTSGKAAETMKELGISAYDSQGNFVGLAEFAGNLRTSLKDLTVEQQQAALKTIFGSDAIRAATVLYSEGEEGIKAWTEAVSDQGYASETAAARLDNLKGDIEELGGALDTALIKTGSAANDTLREMIQWLTSAVDAYTALPPELQSVALGIGVVTAAGGLLGGGLTLLTPKAVEFWGALNTLGVTSKTAGEALLGVGRFLTGPWAVALLAAAAVTTVLVGEKMKLSEKARELAETLDGETGGVTENSVAWAANKLQQEGILSAAKRLGIGAEEMTQAWLGNSDALKSVNGRLEEWRTNADFRMDNQFKGWSEDLVALDYALDGSNTVLKEAKTRHDELAEATAEAGEATAGAGGAVEAAAGQYGAAAEEAGSLTSKLMDLLDAMNELNGIGQTAEQTNSAVQDSLQGLNEYVANAQAGMEGYVLSLDASTAAGAANRSMLADHAEDVYTDAKAQLELEANTLGAEQAAANFEARLQTGRQQIYDTALALSGSADEAQKLTDKVLSMPDQKEIDVLLQGAYEAMNTLTRLEAFKFAPKVLTVEEQFFRNVMYKNPGDPSIPHADGGIMEYANGGIQEYANGGLSTGIYSGGTPIIKFAEQETGWEAFISGKPSERDRNRQIWVEAGNRLGVGAGGQSTVYVPTSVTVKDVNNRLIGTMEVVADGKIDQSLGQQAQAGRKAGR